MTGAAEIDWTPTKQVTLGPDPEMHLYAEVSLWFHKLKVFREREDARMFQSTPNPEDRAIHKALVSPLIVDGEHLLTLLEQSAGLMTNPERIKSEDLVAAVESLRDTYRGWHEPLPSEKRNQILKQVFPDLL